MAKDDRSLQKASIAHSFQWLTIRNRSPPYWPIVGCVAGDAWTEFPGDVEAFCADL